MLKFRRHLLESALVLLSCAAPAAAQTAEDLRGLYGPPVAESYQRRPDINFGYGAALAESYVVRPDILLVVAFGEGGEACRLELKPYSASPELFPAPETFSAEEAARIVGDLVPDAARGAAAGPYTLPRPYASFSFEEYEQVTISQEARAEGGGLRGVRVGWKWRSCRVAPELQTRTPPDRDSCFNTGVGRN